MKQTNILMFVVPTLAVLLIADILIFAFTDDWTSGRYTDLAFINVAFVLFLISGLITSKGPNAYVFNMSNTIIVLVYLVLELVVGVVLIVLDPEMMWHVLSQVIMLIIAIVLLLMNHSVNTDSIQRDEVVAENRGRVVEVQDLMLSAFRATQDRDTKKIVENAYDKSRSISGNTQNGLDGVDGELRDLAEEILVACKAGDNDVVKSACAEFCDLCDERDRIVKSKQRKTVT